MNVFRRIAQALAAVAVLIVLAVQAPAQERNVAPLLDQISERAQVVILVPSLAKLSDKLAMVEEALQLGAPELNDALGQFKMVSGLTQGLNDEGAMLLVLEELGGALMGGQPRAYLLAPVRDYEAFLGNFQAQAAANATVAELQLDTGHTCFARKLEGYALLGQTRELVQAYQPARKSDAWLKKVGPLGSHYLTSSDISVIVDVESLSATLAGLSGMVQMLSEMQLANRPQDEQAAARAAAQWFMQGINNVVRDGAALVIGTDVTDGGVGLSLAIQFKANSELAKRFVGGGGAASHLDRLPDKPWLMALSMNAEALGFAHFAESIVPIIEAEDAALAEHFQTMLPNLRAMRGVSMLLMPPTADDDPGVMYVNTPDANAYRQTVGDYIKALNGKTLPGTDQPMTTTYNAGRLKIGDVSVDQYEQRLGAELTGSGYIAAHGEHVVQVTSPDMQLLTDAIKALDANQGVGAGGTIRQTRQSLSPDPALELYVDLSMVVSRAMGALAGAGFNRAGPQANAGQVEASAPIALSVSVREGGLVIRQFVSMEAARVMQTFMPMLQQLVPVDPQAAPF